MSLLTIKHYRLVSGRSPYQDWFDGLKNNVARGNIDLKIRRMALGHFGDSRSVGEGVSEMRIHLSPGYRIYYLLDGASLVILLYGGDKGSQRRDIALAHGYAADYRRRT
jgi:putative addiction module killer protein